MLQFLTQGQLQDEAQMSRDGGQALDLNTLHQGRVGRGFQMASGGSVGQAGNPFPHSTLRMQAPFFKAGGLDLEAEIPGLVWGTVNVELGYRLKRLRPDVTIEAVDWTAGLIGEGRIAPESFSFVRCRLTYENLEHSGLIYLPHPETKPSINAHRFDVLEVLTSRVKSLAYGRPASFACRADAFEVF